MIDPVTVLAQIINFLILVALLKHFLYGPITQAMKQREQTIADRLEEAAQQDAIARQKAARLHQMQQDFAADQDQRLAQLRSQLDRQRLTLLDQTEQEVTAARSRWYQTLECEKAAVLQGLRQQVMTQLSQVVRQILQDLANADLETQMVVVFQERLNQLPGAEQQQLQTSLGQGGPVVIRSSFPLQADSQQRLMVALQTTLNCPTLVPKFETDSTLGCGLELRVPGYKLDWNLAAYCDHLDDQLALTCHYSTPAPSALLSV